MFPRGEYCATIKALLPSMENARPTPNLVEPPHTICVKCPVFGANPELLKR